MVWVDYLLIGIVVVSTLISLIRGFVKEALSLLVWVAAVFVARMFADRLAPFFADSISTPSLRLGLAYVILFVATLIVGGVVNYLVGQLVKSTGLSGTDRIIGMGFGAARGLLVACVMILIAQLTPLVDDPWWKQSVVIETLEPLTKWLKANGSAILDKAGSISDSIEKVKNATGQ